MCVWGLPKNVFHAFGFGGVVPARCDGSLLVVRVDAAVVGAAAAALFLLFLLLHFDSFSSCRCDGDGAHSCGSMVSIVTFVSNGSSAPGSEPTMTTEHVRLRLQLERRLHFGCGGCRSFKNMGDAGVKP